MAWKRASISCSGEGSEFLIGLLQVPATLDAQHKWMNIPSEFVCTWGDYKFFWTGPVCQIKWKAVIDHNLDFFKGS